MKRTQCIVLMLISFATLLSGRQPKYIFYFIGDGMGMNHVNGTEMYLAARQNRIGREPLTFTTFPYAGIVTTFSKSSPITDSAAAGTALATGTKTLNGTIGMDSAQQVSLHNLAEMAHEKGYPVGLITTVSIDHATPAVFYSHKPLRSTFYEIGTELPTSGFEFFAGAGLMEPTNWRNHKDPNLFDLIARSGYTLIRGNADYSRQATQADKIILLQDESCNPDCIPFAIDRQEGDLALPEMTALGIEFLAKQHKGFFMMVEGGKIDWAAHSNDGATVFAEVIDFDQAVRKAYDFYLQKPDSTLIVVTADHETGGLGLGTRRYKMNLAILANQRMSEALLSVEVLNMRLAAQAAHTSVAWEQVQQLLREKLGFWDTVTLTSEQEERLRHTWQEMVDNKEEIKPRSEYFVEERLAQVAVGLLNEIARIGWTTSAHTAGYVPLFAIGVGAERFTGLMDNTDIPKRIAEVGGY